MSQSNSVTLAEIRSVLEPFDLGEIRAVSPVAGSFRAHWLATTRGRYVLSIFGTEVTSKHLAAMQSVRQHLAAAGLPVVAPIADRSGRSMLVIRDRLAEIQPFVDHHAHARSWTAFAVAARTLAQLHDGMAACTAEPEQRDAPWVWPTEMADRLATDASSLRAAGARSGHEITGAISIAEKILATLAARPELQAHRTATQLTHGDFQGPNILLRGNKVRAVVDFERLDHRPRLFDLAWPLVFWRFFGSERGDWTEHDWQAAARCCRAYHAGTTRPPSQQEWLQLPALMAAIPAYGIAEAMTQPDPVGEVRAFACALPFAEMLIGDPQAALARLRNKNGPVERADW